MSQGKMRVWLIVVKSRLHHLQQHKIEVQEKTAAAGLYLYMLIAIITSRKKNCWPPALPRQKSIGQKVAENADKMITGAQKVVEKDNDQKNAERVNDVTAAQDIENKEEKSTTGNDIQKQPDTANTAITVAPGTAVAVAKQTPAVDSIQAGKAAAPTTKIKPMHPWKIGFTTGGGISSVTQNLFQSAPVYNASIYQLNAPGGTIVQTGATNIMMHSSFSAGAFVQKALTRKLSLSVGLNYHYYSTEIHIGTKFDSVTSSNGPAAAQPLTKSYYRSGSSDAYINQYHFLELPVQLQLQLNNNKKWQLYWQAGASLSQLLGSNALHYSTITNVYFADNSLLGKTQVGISTALLAGFVYHKALIRVGPQLQYGITDVLKNNKSNSQHLLFGGLQLIVIPGKK